MSVTFSDSRMRRIFDSKITAGVSSEHTKCPSSDLKYPSFKVTKHERQFSVHVPNSLIATTVVFDALLVMMTEQLSSKTVAIDDVLLEILLEVGYILTAFP